MFLRRRPRRRRRLPGLPGLSFRVPPLGSLFWASPGVSPGLAGLGFPLGASPARLFWLGPRRPGRILLWSFELSAAAACFPALWRCRGAHRRASARSLGTYSSHSWCVEWRRQTSWFAHAPSVGRPRLRCGAPGECGSTRLCAAVIGTARSLPSGRPLQSCPAGASVEIRPFRTRLPRRRLRWPRCHTRSRPRCP